VVLHDYALYKSTFTLLYFTPTTTAHGNVILAHAVATSCCCNSYWPWIGKSWNRLPDFVKNQIQKMSGYNFLFTFHNNYGRIFSHFWDIQWQRMAWPWNRG